MKFINDMQDIFNLDNSKIKNLENDLNDDLNDDLDDEEIDEETRQKAELNFNKMKDMFSSFGKQFSLLEKLRNLKEIEKQKNKEHSLYLFDEIEYIQKNKDNTQEFSEKLDCSHIPDNILRKDILLDIEETEKTCSCGCELTKIGEEISEKLHFEYLRIVVQRYIRPKYTCKNNCKEADKIKFAEMPLHLIPQSIATSSLLAYLITTKFEDGIPLYQQANVFKEFGFDISKETISSWLLEVAKACKPLIELMYSQVQEDKYLHIHKVNVQILDEKKQENTENSSMQNMPSMWITKTGEADNLIFLFHYSSLQSAEALQENLQKILGNFKGFLQTNALADFAELDKIDGITHVVRLANIRKKFTEILKSGGKNAKSGLVTQVINLIEKIDKIEKGIEERNESIILAVRNEKVRPILDKIETLLKSKKNSFSPQSSTGMAISYALDHWDKVLAYLQLPYFTPDNNTVENTLINFKEGKKNWFFSGIDEIDASLCFYSLIETAKFRDIAASLYLTELFEKLPYAKTQEDYEKLLVANFEDY